MLSVSAASASRPVFQAAGVSSRHAPDAPFSPGLGGNLATNYFLPVLVSYLVFSAGWTVSLIWRFANVPSEG